MAVVVVPRLGRRAAVAVSVGYLAVWLGLDAVAAVFQAHSEVSLWYPPTGLTFALLLILGLRFTPVLLLTDVLHGLLVTGPRVGWVSVEVRSVLSTAVYAGAVWLLRHRARIDPRLPAQRDVTWFLALACLGAPLLVAAVQVVQYDLAGLLRWRDLPSDVFGFWSGSATGIGVLAPALLVGSRRWPLLWPGRPALPSTPVAGTWRGRAELAGQTALLLATVYLAFGPPAQRRLDFTALVYVPLLWVAVRRGLAGTVAAVLLVNVLAVALVGAAAREHPLRLQLGLMTMTLAGLALGAFAGQRRADLEDARHAAVHDPLTGLANRVLLTDRMVAAVHRHQRDPAALPAVLYCDLDGFKGVNDGLGHDAGDELLVAVARRLEQTVRPGDLVSRLGGDELLVLLDGIDPAQVPLVADRAVTALREPYQVADREVVISASIGVAALQPGIDFDRLPAEQTAEVMLRAGDAALQQAKQRGGNQMQLFSPPLAAHARTRLELHADLRRALADRQITVAYQPVFTLPDLQLTGVEALARWHDRARGQVEPTEFIAAAEQTGLIHDLGRHVLDRACGQLAIWRAAGHEPDLRMAVNMSGRQLLDPDLPARVLAVLDRHGLLPTDLELEITESSLTDPGGPGRASVQQLSAAGVRLAIDDFGTGWSSFQSLRELNPHTLKIDRSFTARLQDDPASGAIVQAILAMAGHLGMTVTAEGVETEQQLARLRDFGCPKVQGFLLGRPLPPLEVPSLALGR